jgi:hypothetical protein
VGDRELKQHAGRVQTLQQRILHDWRIVWKGGGKCVGNVGDFAEIESHTKYTPMIYINFIIIKSFETEKKEALLLYHPL